MRGERNLSRLLSGVQKGECDAPKAQQKARPRGRAKSMRDALPRGQ